MRTRVLPEGWYPSTEDGIRRNLAEWGFSRGGGRSIAGIVPHAGWAFCGAQIASVLTAFPEAVDTVVVLGGHNPPGGSLVRYGEASWEFAAGILDRDTELMDSAESRLGDSFGIRDEQDADNTVEVVMAMAAALYPGVGWAAWRIPADERAEDFGEALAEAATATGRRLVVVGSTDLTHYGSNYGYTPPESLDDPVSWVAARDRRILEAMSRFESSEVLTLASEERSACSAGGAVAALSYARAAGAGTGKILDYRTSREVYPATSFVGYGSVTWDAV